MFQHFAKYCLYCTRYFIIAQLGFCLPFKLWFRHLHRNYSGKAFAEIIAAYFKFQLFENLVLFAE